jgi:hypothetical protein
MAAALVVLCVIAGAAAWYRSRPASMPAGVYWVFFRPEAARSTAPPALGAEALRLRRQLNIPIFENDRPLPRHLLQRVHATGAAIRHESRWLRAVSVRADVRALRRIRQLPEVAGIRPVASLRMADATARPLRPVNTMLQAQDSAFYGPNWSALRELGIPAVHALGFTGGGVRIAIIDTGFEPRHESLFALNVIAARDFINDDGVVFNEPGDQTVIDPETHGTAVWSIMGGRRPGQVVGPAYEAHFALAKVDNEPGDTQADEDRWVAAVEWAEAQGVRVINSSVAFRFDFTDKPAYVNAQMDGNTTVTTIAADEIARRGIVLVVAMGNNGPVLGSLSAPADGDSVISVGATNPFGAPAVFNGGATARGPTADGRQKPDLAARGVGLRAAFNLGPADYTPAVAGTSYAAALMAGAIVTFLQAWPDFMPLEVRNALQLAGSRASAPDNTVGHGVPDVASAIMLPDGLTASAVSPIDLQGTLVSVAPTFTWQAPRVHPLLRSVLYTVEIATDPVFTQVIQRDTIRELSTLSWRTPLRPAPALWWRVMASCAPPACAPAGALEITRTSAVASPFSVPRWVRLISPAPNQVTFVNDPRPEFSWAPLAAPEPVGPLVYDLEVLDAETGLPVQPALRNLSTANVRLLQQLIPNVDYRWRVIARTRSGAADTVMSSSAFVVTSNEQPPATLLYLAFPNPFPRSDLGAAETRVWFDLAANATVDLAVFDQRARFVRQLIPAEPGCGPVTLPPGQYGRDGGGDACVRTTWDGRDAQGRAMPRGVYVIRLRTNGRDQYVRVAYLPDGSYQ